jgi:Co/Zn/Cd efflux system component
MFRYPISTSNRRHSLLRFPTNWIDSKISIFWANTVAKKTMHNFKETKQLMDSVPSQKQIQKVKNFTLVVVTNFNKTAQKQP